MDDTGAPNYYDSPSKSDSVDLTVTNIIYVDASVSGGKDDGSSWANAFDSLQEALGAAESAGVTGNEIWVADGTYYPDEGTGHTNDDRTEAFELVANIAVYGGFNGTETTRSSRDPATNVAILSGDIDKDSTLDSDNSYNVVVGATDATIDGFTITMGYADGSFPYDSGGGMYNEDVSPTVTDCEFTDNEAVYWGGGMWNYDHSSPTVTNCTFSNNNSSYLGGGMCNHYYSSPTVTDCNFSNNTAYASGGGVYNSTQSSPTITDCAFIENEAQSGAGICDTTDCSSVVTNCTFSSNEAGYSGGGGIFNYKNSATITNCTFKENSTTGIGGGMRNAEVHSITVENCVFSGNTAETAGGGVCNYYVYTSSFTNCSFSNNEAGSGGGMFNWDSDPAVTNCCFSGNAAELYGGGMYNSQSSDFETTTLTNCTFAGNTAGTSGGGLQSLHYTYESVTVRAINCIFWDNGDNVNRFPEDTADVRWSYSNIEDSNGSGDGWNDHFGTDGGHNIDIDPNFVDPNDPDGDDDILGTSDDGLQLSAGSPCIDKGANYAISEPNDITGSPRKVDGDGDQTVTVDMGAYEYQGS